MIEPVPLTEARVADAGRLLSGAFIDDPGTAVVEPDPARRWEVNRVLFELDVASTLGSAWLAGVAIWLAPDSVVEAFDDGTLSGIQSIVGRAVMDRWLAMLTDFERVRAEAIGAPHWFLALLGVDRLAQGRGIGTALLQVGHAAADRDGLPCFLETFTEPNVAYYQRRGYVMTRSTTIGPDVPIHAMTRPPGPAA
jgi:GNAT superfamily N-acetyltransferase